jgi:hypothetical protein
MEISGWVVLAIIVALASTAFLVWLFLANRRDGARSGQPFDAEEGDTTPSAVGLPTPPTGP